MEIISIVIYICLFLSGLLSFSLIKKKKRVHKQRPTLPPGPMGWPYLGETLQLYSQDPNVFFDTKQKRFFITI